ncbi:hypothetical protein HanXRQr2_Chr17g0822271 [Helianthus annuus]|uniref:Uncharacterized protein n=1 Tax=Helianthus annuus TaxID=4232 RepID=A0A9K3DKM6_HELAN|nr:hypothetical protein HanXRQr2_Chr17g0822271 [Helianthus annuus]
MSPQILQLHYPCIIRSLMNFNLLSNRVFSQLLNYPICIHDLIIVIR